MLQDNVPLDLRPTLALTQKNVLPTTLRISSTGDVCLSIDKVNTCTKPYITTVSEKNYLSPYIVPVAPKAGMSTLIVQICQENKCATQTLPYLITP